MGRVAESVAVTIQSPPSKGNKSKAMLSYFFLLCGYTSDTSLSSTTK